MNEEKKCEECGGTLTATGVCFTCLAKKHEEPDDDEGTWFNKG